VSDILVLGKSNSRYSDTSDGMADTQSSEDLVKLLKTKGDLLRLRPRLHEPGLMLACQPGSTRLRINLY
jgi:hypothetical protein